MSQTSEPTTGRPDGDWPHRETSRAVEVAGLRWHVQVTGRGPGLLLIHGTGSSTHSWAEAFPALGDDFTVVAPDLPGHGFSASLPAESMTSEVLADRLATLLEALEVDPAIVAGHSAGAAIGLRIALRRSSIAGLVGIAPSLAAPWPSAPRALERIVRRAGSSPTAARLAAGLARAGATSLILGSARSDISPRSRELYRRLVSRPEHAGAALSMMSFWDGAEVEALLGAYARPALLLAGGRDAWVSPAVVRRVGAAFPAAEVEVVPGTGHLLHEERPADVASRIVAFARDIGVLRPEE